MIACRGLVKTHRRGETEVSALRGIDCDLPGGAMTFIVGPSGSGKSSLLYLIGALDQPSMGEIAVGGRSLAKFSRIERDRYRREEVGFVFQNFNLLSNLTALENVLVPQFPRGIAAAQRAAAEALLHRVGLGARLHHRPSQLSGGEQQRVALARALLKRPQLILADEPTGELDSQSGAEVYRYLRELRDETQATVVVVTHDRTYIQPGDFVLSLRDGRVVDFGPHGG